MINEKLNDNDLEANEKPWLHLFNLLSNPLYDTKYIFHIEDSMDLFKNHLGSLEFRFHLSFDNVYFSVSMSPIKGSDKCLVSVEKTDGDCVHLEDAIIDVIDLTGIGRYIDLIRREWKIYAAKLAAILDEFSGTKETIMMQMINKYNIAHNFKVGDDFSEAYDKFIKLKNFK